MAENTIGQFIAALRKANGLTQQDTIYLQKKERIHIPVWGWALLILVLILAGTLLAINLIPPSFGVIGHSTPATPVPDASVGLDN